MLNYNYKSSYMLSELYVIPVKVNVERIKHLQLRYDIRVLIPQFLMKIEKKFNGIMYTLNKFCPQKPLYLNRISRTAI